MIRTLTCPSGHHWDAAPESPAPGDPVSCPVCGGLALTFVTAAAVPAADAPAPPPGESVLVGTTGGGGVTLSCPTGPYYPAGLPAGPPELAGYRVLGFLGKGGMGVVYKALHLPLNRVVALKLMRAGPDADPDLRARFRKEAESAARLQHPNVVQIYEVGQVGEVPYIALEYAEHGTLADRLGGKPQPPRAAAELVRTLARAVHAAHQCGILHRDLKPANVLLQRDPGQGGGELLAAIPKIGDFGLARPIEGGSGLSLAGQIVGTPGYMAPEQAGAGRDVGPAVDVYALGVILYEMLTGRPPFLGHDPLDTLRQVRSQEPVPPSRLQPKVPRDLETVCLKCLHKEPHHRYVPAEALAEDLDRFLAGRPILARRAAPLERLAKWVRRRPAVAALLALSLLGLLLGLAEGLRYQRQLERHNVELRREREHAEKVIELLKLTHAALQEVVRLSGPDAEGNPVGEESWEAGLRTVAAYNEEIARRCGDDPDLQDEAAAARQVAERINTALAAKAVRTELADRRRLLLETRKQIFKIVRGERQRVPDR
jgi:hypothetical protein